MKLLLRIIGIGAIVIGGLWALQGLGIAPGSFMTGDRKWAFYGLGLALLGLLLIWRGWEKRG